MIRLTFAAVHLLALGIGLAAVWVRAGALRAVGRGGGSLRTVFAADNWWIVALTLWLVTGLVRALAGLEKPGPYYLYNTLFQAKMAAAAAVYVLEMWPMATLIQWGIWIGKGRDLDPRAAPALAVISYVQVALLLVILGLAAAMARGYGVAAR
jgi:putative membrane protein